MIKFPEGIDEKKKIRSAIRHDFFVELGEWDRFKTLKAYFRGLGFGLDFCDYMSEGIIRGRIEARNEFEATGDVEVRLAPAQLEAVKDSKTREQEEDGFRCELYRLASGRKCDLSKEVSWVSRNIHRPWRDVSRDVPSEGSLTLLEWANANESEFRKTYHSKPKAVSASKESVGPDKAKAVLGEHDRKISDTIGRLLGAESS